jgi:hypothetical protein
MAVNNIDIPPAPTPGTERWREDIWPHRRNLILEERADPTWRATGNDAWWVEFFNARRKEELRNTKGSSGHSHRGTGRGGPISGPCRDTLSSTSSTATPGPRCRRHRLPRNVDGFQGGWACCKGKLPLSVFLVINDNPYGPMFSLSFL